MKKTILFSSLILFVFFMTTSCFDSEKAAEKITEKIAKQATGEDIDIKTDKKDKKSSVTIKGKDGEEVTFSGGDTELPDDLPSDVFVPQGDIDSSGTIDSPDGKLITINMYCKESVADIKTKISEEMKKNGWTQSAVMDVEDSAMINYAKGENTVTVIINLEGEKTAVSYMVGISTK